MKPKFENRIVAYLTDEMSAEEKITFLEEVNNSPDLKRELDSYNTIWGLTNQLNYSQEESDTSWEYFQRKIEAPFNLLGLDWLKIAASITLLAAVSFGMWFFGSTDINLTTKEATLTQQLVDQTKIKLDYNSQLTYDEEFSSTNRRVSLKGHAFFDVSHSSENFVIECDLGKVTVHGTAFNLLSVKNALILELIDGSVSFSNNQEQIFLKPYQRLEVYGSEVRIEEFNEPTEWNEEIQCTNTPLTYIFEQLSLVYGIHYDLPQKVLADKYTVTLPKNDIQSCIRILSKISGQNFALIDKSVVLQ